MAAGKGSKRTHRTSSSTPDESSWRAFERLVARIETALAPIGAQILCPDRIRDHATGELREVDASIRYKVGTTPILIILECRERSRQQDSLWIEQLATKRDHIQAAKCVAISATGFTSAAVRKAETVGIELRHLTRLDEQAITDLAPLRTWFFEYKLTFFDPSFAIPGRIEINTDLDRKLIHTLAKRQSLHKELLYSRTPGKRRSLREYIEMLLNRMFEGMPAEDRAKLPIGEEITLGFSFPPSHYVKVKGVEYDLFAIGLRVIFTYVHDFTLTRSGNFDYAGPYGTLVTGHEFDGAERVTGKQLRVSVHTDTEENRTVVSVWDDKDQLIKRSEIDKP